MVRLLRLVPTLCLVFTGACATSRPYIVERASYDEAMRAQEQGKAEHLAVAASRLPADCGFGTSCAVVLRAATLRPRAAPIDGRPDLVTAQTVAPNRTHVAAAVVLGVGAAAALVGGILFALNQPPTMGCAMRVCDPGATDRTTGLGLLIGGAVALAVGVTLEAIGLRVHPQELDNTEGYTVTGHFADGKR